MLNNKLMEQSQHAKVERFIENGELLVKVHGRLDRDSASLVFDWIEAWLPKDAQPVGLDLGGIDYLDSAGVAVLVETLRIAKQRKCKLELVRVSEPARRMLELFRFHGELDSADEDKPGFLERLGEKIARWISETRWMLLLLADIFYWAVWGPFSGIRGAPRGEITRQVILLGSRAFGIVALLAFLIGLTLALLSALQLRQFGANIYVANLVAIAMAREMGPIMTAIIVAGRSGSAVAAEIATMKVTEEVDALETMGFSPVRFLVIPKLYSITLTQPLLTVVSVAFGILGGMAIGATALGVPPHAYLQQTVDALALKDMTTGLLKSVVFGWIILVISTYCGLKTRGGAEAVGLSTTQSVVWAIFSVIITDCLFSLAFYT